MSAAPTPLTWALVTPALITLTEDQTDPPAIGPGLGGFLVVFFLAVATYLLVRSMTGHLRKVRYSPDPAEPAEPAEPSDEAPATDEDRPTA